MSGISPWFVGQTSPSWVFALKPGTGSFNATGLNTTNFALFFVNKQTNIRTQARGTIGIQQANPAILTFTPDPLDTPVDTSYTRLFRVEVEVYVNGQTDLFVIPEWKVVPR